jgi:predicted Zn-dependent peptidase
MDVLSDMLFESRLSAEDMDNERRVIFEEISLYEDSPEDLVYDLLSEAAWGNTSMGRNILGTQQTLNNITPEIMRNYMRTHYTNKNMIISVSGNYDETFFDLLEQYFGGRDIGDNEIILPDAVYSPSNIIRTKDIEQVQLVAGFNGIDVMDENVYSLLVFNNVFGSGMSSRLFQNIREKLGLVYSVCAGHSAYMNTGIFDISAGMNPDNVERVAELISKEVKRVKKEKLSSNEVARAKEQLKGSYILSYESTGARMQGAGRSMLLNKPILTQEEALEKIDNVTTDSVAAIIDKVLDTDTLSVAAVGPIENVDNLFDF